MKRLRATQLHLFDPRPYETPTAVDGALATSTPTPVRRTLTDYPELMTVDDVAEYIGIATSTAYLHVNDPDCWLNQTMRRVGGRIFVLRHLLGCPIP